MLLVDVDMLLLMLLLLIQAAADARAMLIRLTPLIAASCHYDDACQALRRY